MHFIYWNKKEQLKQQLRHKNVIGKHRSLGNIIVGFCKTKAKNVKKSFSGHFLLKKR